jgi:HSP20 family protein
MQKPTRPKTLSRHLSERARAAGGNADQPAPEIAGLGGAAAEILGRLKDVFEQVAQAAGAQAHAVDSTAGDGQGDIPFTLGGKQGRMVFGYTMRMGLDGLKAEAFGDIPPAASPKPGAAMKPAARAPIVDVFEEADQIRIVAELPGVASENVSCTLQGDTLQIETDTPPRYSKSLVLPCPVNAATLVQSCSNGILEIRIDRAAA